MHELGNGVYYRKTTCSHKGEEITGLIVGFSDGCEGLVSFCDDCDGNTWTLKGEFPNITVDPSIQCRTHPEHHGWIRDGKWTTA